MNDDNFRPYQDDLDADEDMVDPLINEETDDPTDTLQIPEDEFKDELDRIVLDPFGDEDMRETIEDQDEEKWMTGR